MRHLDDDQVPGPYVSNGHLPDGERVHTLLEEAHRAYRSDDTGITSSVYPALQTADPDRFGLAVVDVAGATWQVGDATVPFTIMSVAKPFVFAAVYQQVGQDAVRKMVGLNATGLPFNSVSAIERSPGGRTNPMVNPGAIATTSLSPGTGVEDRWSFVVGYLSRFAGRELTLDHDVFTSATATNHRNRAIARLLHDAGALGCGPNEAVEVYTRQSCLSVTAVDLAVMGATLADGGVNPLTGEQVVDQSACRATLAVMATAGMYETSGDWLYDVGLPAKSGIGGGIVTVSPGKGGLGTYSPRLDPAGNSVRGQLATRYLSRGLGLDLFASQAHPGT